jgi:hypothetical protein
VGNARVVPGWSLALIGNASAHKIGAKTCSPGRGIFDKETRRKPLAFAADAAPMAFESCFGTPWRSRIVGGTPKNLGHDADLAGEAAARTDEKEQMREFHGSQRHQCAGV